MKTKNKLRAFYHILIGFSIMYFLGVITDFSNYTIESKAIGVPLLSTIIGGLVGFFWEWLQAKLTESYIRFLDICISIIGTIIGGIMSLFFVNVYFMWGLLVISLLVILHDFLFIWKLKK